MVDTFIFSDGTLILIAFKVKLFMLIGNPRWLTWEYE